MKFASNLLLVRSPGYVSFESSPAHLLVLAIAVLLLVLTVVVIVVLWRDHDRGLWQKVVWSAIALLVPVIGSIAVGTVLLWQRGRNARLR